MTMTCYRYTFLWLLSFFLTLSGMMAQAPGYVKFGIKEGLPSMNVYSVEFDQDGIMWIATDFGVVRYDGTDFRRYGLEDGLPGLDVVDLYPEGDRFWIRSHGRPVGIWDKQKFLPLPKQDFDFPLERLWIYRDGHNNIYLYNNKVPLVLESTPSGTVTHLGQFIRWKDSKGRLHTVQEDGHKVNGKRAGRYLGMGMRLFSFDGDTLYLPTYEGLFRIIDGNPELVLNLKGGDARCQDMEFVGDHILMAYTDGLFMVRRKGGIYEGQLYFPEMNVQSIAVDPEGGVWLGTHQNGLLYIPELEARQYEFSSVGQFFEVEADRNGNVYAAGSLNRVGKLEGGELVEYALPQRGRGKAMDMLVTKEGDVWTVFDHVALKNTELKPEKPYLATLKAMADGPGDQVYVSDRVRGLFLAPENALLQRSLKNSQIKGQWFELDSDLNLQRISDWAWELQTDLQTGTLWGVGEAGIFSYREGKLTQHGLADANVRHIDVAEEGPLLFCSEDGKVWYEDQGKILPWELDFPTPQVFVQNIYAEAPGITWLATRGSVYLIRGRPGDAQAQIQSFPARMGRFLSVVNDLCVVDSTLWLATRDGLFAVPRHLMDHDTAAPGLVVDSLQADSQAFHSGALLPYQALIKVWFRGISYQQGPVSFRYQLIGQDTSWKLSGQNNLFFSNLSPGNYTLRIQAQKANGNVSPVREISWTIKTPFWLQVWFKVLMTMLGLGFIASLIYTTARIRRNYEKRRAYILNLERKALRAQMNPHFLFNALNSLHVYIGNNEERKAHLFLSKFAKLTRLVLTASEESYVTLASELEAAKYFLELEQLRHGEGFDYEIKYEIPFSSEKLAVPSLLIQPLLENAILHGVRHLSDRRGRILLRITGEEQLNIIIEDNGVGRAAAQKINAVKTPGHQSKGSQITIERIRLIKGAAFRIEDLHSAADKPFGTRCQIFLPWKPIPDLAK